MGVALAAALVAQAAWAHTETAVGGGFVRGFLHPFNGGDHLLAMVA
ncbi:MAG TPA: HupE/UreJ family protein, partial [Ramlibacter sp.]